MYSKSVLLIAVLFVVCCSGAVPKYNLNKNKLAVKVETSSNTIEKFSFCKNCLNLAEEGLNILLNYVLQVGVIGSCGEICSYVESKTQSKTLGAVCNILCDVVGVEEFVKIIEKSDLDPIYYCELLKVCEINDNGDARITNFTVSPFRAPQGEFDAKLEYTSLNGTGTGEIVVIIKTVDNVPLEASLLSLPQQPGNYTTKITINAQPDPDCDPSQGPCEQWLPGLYYINVFMCNGECGSKHPHSKVYDQALSNFTITD